MPDIRETINEFKENPVRYIKTFAMDIVVILVAIAYVLYQMVKLEPTELNPLVLIAQAIMGIICGVVIKQALGENGFSKGYNSQTWIDEEDKYNSACNVALPYMDRIDNYYQYEEIDNKKKCRRAILQGVHLKYDKWFDDLGDYIGADEEYAKLDFWQKRAIKKCIKLKVYPLNLFSQYATTSEKYTHKEVTDKAQRGKNMTKNTLTATIIAIIGVYFVPVLNSWSWASFFSSTLQVAMWVLFGILQLYTNFNFVVQDKVSVLREKKEHIKIFISGCEKKMYLTNPYDEKKSHVEDYQDITEKVLQENAQVL